MQLREGAGGPQLIVSATDLVGFLECGHLSALDLAVARGELEKPHVKDATLDLIRDRGGRHEERYIVQLERELGRRVTRLKSDWSRSYEERQAETVAAMRRGDDIIYQATVFDGRWVGHPDFLLRVDGRPAVSAAGPEGDAGPEGVAGPEGDAGPEGVAGGGGQLRLPLDGELDDVGEPGVGEPGVGEPGVAEPGEGEPGVLGRDFHYEVADTKLAHSAKASALLQMCSYVDQVARIQGVVPEKVYVVTGGAQIGNVPFRTAEMMAYYRAAKERFEQALAAGLDQAKSYPEPTEHCAVCRWQLACRQRWHADDALPIVAGITRSQREELRDLGITTRAGLASVGREGSDGLVGFEKIARQAALQVESDDRKPPTYSLLKPEREDDGGMVADRGLSALPQPNEGDLFFDIEGDPFAFWAGLEYLFGIWDGVGYEGFWALSRAEEKEKFEQVIDLFVGRFKQFPGMHVYHYGAYEPSHLKQLAGRHATREEELDELLRKRVFVDLYRVVRQGLQAGVESYSIKRLEPLYGFGREIDLRDAGESIVEFEFWLDKFQEEDIDDKPLRDDIQAYNRDDCVSTQKLRDWLEYELRPQAARQFGGELPRPPTEIRPTSEELTERQAKVHALEEILRARADEEEAADDPRSAGATHLLANLLDWHRRENKASWWRFYDLMDKSDNELFDEKEPIAHLEFVDSWPKGGKARSDIYRYRFPVQEYKVDAGNEVHDPRLPTGKTRTGTVEAIDDDERHVDIRRPRDWSGEHPTAIVPLNIYNARAQQEALLRVGEWVAEHGIAADTPEWRAARDLLLRLPPRLAGGDGGVLVRDGESGAQAARRVAPLLGGTTLAIQGPPGSGKTWTGARMIHELVRARRPVAISSNSHKVISNLVKAVLAAGDVTVVQKADEGEAYDHPLVKRAGSNAAVAEALLSGECLVGAGTPWVWASDDLAGVVDTLFVDEAGQVSLANVVAMSACARNVVLLGDPQQLNQPTQGAHPDGADCSALGHFLGESDTVEPERGIFFEQTWRMHPRITEYTSNLFYEGRLASRAGLERQRVLAREGADGTDFLSGAGLRWVPVEHEGRTNASPEEAQVVADIWRSLVGRTWLDADGNVCPLTADDIVIVSPFNAHRLLIQGLLGPTARVGTVDKFQGQEAPVSIYTMATSRPEDAPRGMAFLYSLNRLNVATSRARALAIVVASPALLAAVARTPDQLRMANALCAFADVANERALTATSGRQGRLTVRPSVPE